MDNYHFQRIEKKYLINACQKEELLKRVSQYLKKDKYYKIEIHNIYFDSKNNDLIINSLEKPVFKDKFRVRSYCVPKDDDDVFLEIKMKYKNVVGKRRIKLTLNEYDKFINQHIINDEQIFREINYYFTYYELEPSMYVAYDRYSYLGKDDDGLRITFDYNLRSRCDKLNTLEDVDVEYFFEDDVYIMEIKSLTAMPLWLVNVLSDMKIFPTSFSKYGEIYKKDKLKEVIDYV